MRPAKNPDDAKALVALGQRLAKAREAWGLRQEDIARIAGVSRQAVQGWETGAYEPNLIRLAKLADFLCVTTDWLLLDKGEAPAVSHEKAILRRMHRALTERLDAAV